MEIPDLPANYVMDEFLKAREKAKLPKQGTVAEAASSWYQKHHDWDHNYGTASHLYSHR